jgi:uncharacterized membrane protein (UPF0127 family)
MAQFKKLIGRRTLRYDEGLWMVPPKGIHSFNLGIAVPLDLVYLDENCRVVQAVESFHRVRVLPLRTDAASVLALPAHTIYSSQTQPEHQLVICVPEEMEFRIGSAPESKQPIEMAGFKAKMNPVSLLASWLPHGTSSDRRAAWRHQRPRLVAHDWDGANLVVYGIRDVSTTGLYLMTEKRWRLGALVTMTLQKTDNPDDNSESLITAQLKVTRWGPDGVGLAFVLPESPNPACLPGEEPVSDELEEFAIQSAGKEVIH